MNPVIQFLAQGFADFMAAYHERHPEETLTPERVQNLAESFFGGMIVALHSTQTNGFNESGAAALELHGSVESGKLSFSFIPLAGGKWATQAALDPKKN